MSIPVRYEGDKASELLKKLYMAIIVGIVVLIAVSIVSAFSVFTIDVGEAAVIVDPFQRRIVRAVFGPGVYFKAPWQYVKKVYTAVTTIDFRQEEGTAIDALTRDGARIFVDVTIRFEVKRSPEAVIYLVEKYPVNTREELVRHVITPIVRQVVRDVIAGYTLTEVIEKRSELPSIISKAIREKLEEDETIRLAVNVIDIAVRKILPPENVLRAIEEKLKAQQEALAAKYQLEKQVTLANATKLARIIEAEGEKQAMILRAEGEMKALQLIMKALGNDTRLMYIYLLAQALQKLNGTVILVIPTGNTTPPLMPIIGR